MENRLIELGVIESDVLDILTTLANARKNFEHRGFKVSNNTINNFFIEQYKNFKDSGNLNPRKAAFEMVYRAKFAPIKKTAKIGRNDSCPCNSGKKYKNCCIKK